LDGPQEQITSVQLRGIIGENCLNRLLPNSRTIVAQRFLNATLKFNHLADELKTSLIAISDAENDLWRFDGVNWNAPIATLDANNNQRIKSIIPQFST
jgi:hypothetical protein